MSRPALTLLFLAFLAFFLGLGRAPITDADEAFYARSAWEMVESSDWLTPHFNYEDRWQKPALYYWLTAALYSVTGPTEWSARFWSALSGLGLVFLTWTIAARLPGRGDAAWLAAAIVATCFGCFAIGRMALPDLPLTFCITLGIWAAIQAVDPPPAAPAIAAASSRARGASRQTYPSDASAPRGGTAVVATIPPAGTRHRVRSPLVRWWALGGLAAGLGFLLKGPVALVIPAIVLLPIWWRERRTIVIDARGIAVAVVVAACVGLPWYVAMWGVHGAEYLNSFFVGDNLERFATARFNEPRGAFYYVPVLIGGLLPWSIFLIVLPWRPLIARLRGRVRVSTAEWRLLLWATMPLLFYTASFGKQPRYILPVLPPLGILIASGLASRIAEARAGHPPRALSIATWGTAALFAGCAVVLARTQPLFLDAYPWGTWMGVGALLALSVAIATIAATAGWDRLPAVLPVSAGLLLVTVQFGALAGIRPAPVEQMAALVRDNRAATDAVGVYDVFVRNLVFYTGLRQEVLVDDEAVVEFVSRPERVLLALAEDDLARLEPLAGVPLRRLGSVRYVDTAGIRLGTLLRPDPDRHVQTVVLVANR